jgi:putative DNA primase/helicase
VRSVPALFRAAEVNRDGISDNYNAREFAELSRNRLAFSQDLWRYWNDSIWVVDDCGKRRSFVPKIAEVYQSTADSLESLLRSVSALFAGMKKEERPMEVLNWCSLIANAIGRLRNSAHKICNLRGIDSALTLAQSHLRVPDDVWNRDPYLLAVRNGVVDLRTAELTPAAPNQRITRMAGAAYDPTTKPTAFLKFLERVQPDFQIRDYLQCLAGYCAVGKANEQKFFTFVGSGANGKSTYMGLIMDALGDYAVKGPLSLLAEQSPDKPRNDLAALAGARLVSISETPKNLRLDEATIKAVTGQDVMTARFLNKEFFQFRPCFTPILDTNHPPRPRDAGEGIWRRLVILPWTVMIPEEQRNNNLREELLEDLPGVLAWIIEGAKKYFKNGLPRLPMMIDAKQALRDSCDDLGRWLDESVEQAPQFRVTSAVFYKSFLSWSQAEGNTYPIAQRIFTERLRDKGFEVKKLHGVMTWPGLRVCEHEKDLGRMENTGGVKLEGTAVGLPPPSLAATTLPAGCAPSRAEPLRMPGGSRIA